MIADGPNFIPTLTNRADEQAALLRKAVIDAIHNGAMRGYFRDAGYVNPDGTLLGLDGISYEVTVRPSIEMQLARDFNPATIAAQQAEIHRLNALPVMNPEWRTAVLRFVEEKREDICTFWNGKAFTLHSIAELSAPFFAEVVDRLLCGDISGLWVYCRFCCYVRCGGPELCKEAAKDVLAPEERFLAQLPEHVFSIRERLGRVE